MKTLLCLTVMLLTGCATTAPVGPAAKQGATGNQAGQACHVQSALKSGTTYCFNEDAYLRSMTMR